MKNTLLALVSATAFSVCTSAMAFPMYTIGEAVTNPDRSITFTNLERWTSLVNYQEDGIIVNGDGQSYSYVAFTPFVGYDNRNSDFHYVAAGTYSYVTIKGANKEVFSAVSFLAGNGWARNINYLRFQAYLNGATIDGGQIEMTNGLIKFADTNGFDELRVSSTWTWASFGSRQAIALDDLKIDIKDAATDVPEPGSLALLGLGIIGLINIRRRRAA